MPRLKKRDSNAIRQMDVAGNVRAILHVRAGATRRGVVEDFLRSVEPTTDEAMTLACRMAARIAGDPGVTRVSDLAGIFEMSPRGIQRWFREYVGVTPKWVIQRYRLTAERVAAGGTANWAELALELGYADQAHFIREFKKLTGRAPADDARTLAETHSLVANGRRR